MAIDKTIPNRLQTDLDQRLVRPEIGEMTDAQNVMLSEEGTSSSGVIKNMLGTTVSLPIPAEDRVEDLNAVTVVGSVSDKQRGFVYWFVADNNGSSEHAIYRHNTTNNSYELVLKSSFLNFNPNSFVKADVVNAAFQQDEVIQTALYFTDNINPPRKINVDRQLAGEYGAFGNATSFNQAYGSIKSAPNFIPQISFESNEGISQNNFTKNVFQFSYQYIYTDGEESAMSAYSAPSIPRGSFLSKLDEEGYGISRLIDNVCVIRPETTEFPPDVERLRILARSGNDGPFFVVDEVPLNESVTRDIYSIETEVYNSLDRSYRFYNDSFGSFVDQNTVNKLYDNVPLLAAGQSISGNRLMYSNYTEGRPGVDPVVTMNVNYSSLPSVSKATNFISPADVTNVVFQDTAAPDVKIDLLGGNSFNSLESPPPATATTVVPAGTNIEISFRFSPGDFTATPSSSGSLIQIPAFWKGIANSIPSAIPAGTDPETLEQLFIQDVTGGAFTPVSVNLSTTSVGFNYQGPGGSQGVLAEFVVIQLSVSQDTTIADIVEDIGQSLFNVEREYYYNFSGETMVASPSAVNFPAGQIVTNNGVPVALGQTGNGISPFNGSGSVPITSNLSYSGTAKVTWAFDDIVSTSSTIQIKPRVSNVELTALSLDSPFTQNTPLNVGLPGGGSSVTINSVSGATEFWDDVLVPPGNEQSEINYSFSLSTYMTTPSAKAFASLVIPTFKSGSTHDFGIVYYDEHNRSGNVNELGSVFVEDLQSASRTARGPASVTINFDDDFDPPSWARRFQIVYSGRNSIGDFTQYTVGNAYPFYKNDTSNSNSTVLDVNDKRLALSIIPLSQYNDQKNTTRRYSFTKGDKLRVIKRRSGNIASFTDDYQLASDGETIIEFNIMGVETFDESNHHLIEGAETSHDDTDPHLGEFLILEAPEITSLISGTDGNVLKYLGYDWFQVTGEQRNASDTSTATSYWPGSLVEIYSPKSESLEKVYYEIGHGGIVGNRKDTSINDHGDSIVVTNGDCWFRPVSCRMAYDSPELPDDWFYQTLEIESDNINDEFESKIWAKGRPHLVFENSATVRRYNGITYSDAYAEDVANLSLSSFNGSLANFFSLESANGACNYIGTLNDQFLVALQENKMSMVPVNKNILQQSQGGNLAALSTQVLNDPRYYVGDYGCGNNPESVLIRDGQVFFVDSSRSTVCRFTSEGISPISEKGVASLFRDELADFTAQGGTRIVSGYDPRYDHYYVTLRPTGTFNGLTLGYARGIAEGGAWQSRYTFFPDMYSNQNDMMYSAVYRDPEGDDNATIFYSHDNETRNSFYGDDAAPSIVQVVSNANPSMVKVFNSISLEGDSANWDATPIVTDLNSNGASLGFVEKEGAYYSFITRDTNGTKHITGVGRVASLGSGADTITFENRVNRNPIPYGSNIRLISNGAYDNIGPLEEDVTFVRFVDAYTIEVAGTINLLLSGLVGGDLVAISESTINGDPIRGHWAEITLTNNQTTAFELFCVNTHIAQSKQDHSLGQQ